MIDSDHLNDLPRPALDLNTSAADFRKIIDDAEKRTLEMIADGASLRDVLDQLCSAIDVQVAPSVTTILLMDADGKRLCHGGGPRVPREWISTITPLPVVSNPVYAVPPHS